MLTRTEDPPNEILTSTRRCAMMQGKVERQRNDSSAAITRVALREPK